MDAVERKVSVKEQQMAEKEELNKKKKNQQIDNNFGFPPVLEQEDSEGDVPKDTDKPLAQKFKTYELTWKDIQNILSYWDRKQGVQMPHTGAEELPHEPDDQRQVPSGGRRGRKDRERERAEKERAEKERAEKERLEREKAERERLEKLRAMEEQSDGGEADKDKEEDHEGKKDLGVPFINIQVPDLEGINWKQALECDRLPKVDQVQTPPGWRCNKSGPRCRVNHPESVCT